MREHKQKPLLTVADLQRRFRVSRTTIWHWRKHAGLPTVRVQGNKRDSIRFDPEEVREWAKRNGLGSFVLGL